VGILLIIADTNPVGEPVASWFEPIIPYSNEFSPEL
jgi:hypothetical protein